MIDDMVRNRNKLRLRAVAMILIMCILVMSTLTVPAQALATEAAVALWILGTLATMVGIKVLPTAITDMQTAFTKLYTKLSNDNSSGVVMSYINATSPNALASFVGGAESTTMAVPAASLPAMQSEILDALGADGEALAAEIAAREAGTIDLSKYDIDVSEWTLISNDYVNYDSLYEGISNIKFDKNNDTKYIIYLDSPTYPVSSQAAHSVIDLGSTVSSSSFTSKTNYIIIENNNNNKQFTITYNYNPTLTNSYTSSRSYINIDSEDKDIYWSLQKKNNLLNGNIFNYGANSDLSPYILDVDLIYSGNSYYYDVNNNIQYIGTGLYFGGFITNTYHTTYIYPLLAMEKTKQILIEKYQIIESITSIGAKTISGTVESLQNSASSGDGNITATVMPEISQKLYTDETTKSALDTAIGYDINDVTTNTYDTTTGTEAASSTDIDIGGLNLDSLGVLFTTKFPFSIPWDIKRIFGLLQAPAKAPYFEIDLFAPLADRIDFIDDTTIVLDLSQPQFEIIGQVCRWASIVGFCLLLAVGTKRMIWTA